VLLIRLTIITVNTCVAIACGWVVAVVLISLCSSLIPTILSVLR